MTPTQSQPTDKAQESLVELLPKLARQALTAQTEPRDPGKLVFSQEAFEATLIRLTVKVCLEEIQNHKRCDIYTGIDLENDPANQLLDTLCQNLRNDFGITP